MAASPGHWVMRVIRPPVKGSVPRWTPHTGWTDTGASGVTCLGQDTPWRELVGGAGRCTGVVVSRPGVTSGHEGAVPPCLPMAPVVPHGKSSVHHIKLLIIKTTPIKNTN